MSTKQNALFVSLISAEIVLVVVFCTVALIQVWIN